MRKYLWTLLFFMVACTTPPTFRPEVGGEGAMYSKGGVVFSIPPQHPVLKMKIASMIIPKKRAHVRLYFMRKGPPADEYLDPQEQVLLLPDSPIEIHPSSVHADISGKPMIKLANSEKQAVELIFPLPEDRGHEFPYLILKWKIHYQEGGKDQVMAEVERFNYERPMEPTGTVGAYDASEFPEGDPTLPIPDMWMFPGLSWW